MSRSSRRHTPLPAEPERLPPPLGRRVAALDLGERRIGVAVTDPGGSFVAARQVVHRGGSSRDRRALHQLLDANAGATLVIGLPLNADATDNNQTARTRRWADTLLHGRPEPIVWWNEHLTTQAAQSAGAAPADLDARAAELILLDYLRSRPA